VIINEDKQLILRKLNSITKNANYNTNNKNEISKNKNRPVVDSSSQTDFPPRDPLEAVKTFADQLSRLDISESNLRTSVLYALLKNNEFSIEDTKRKLFEARTAITESLVLPISRISNNGCDKRSHLITISDQKEDSFRPKKKFCSGSNRFTAKKSFPTSRTETNYGKRPSNQKSAITSGLYSNANYFSQKILENHFS